MLCRIAEPPSGQLKLLKIIPDDFFMSMEGGVVATVRNVVATSFGVSSSF
jgi:hypothetical protein